jgi:hypothetical protein
VTIEQTTCLATWTITQTDPTTGATTSVQDSYGGDCTEAQTLATEHSGSVTEVTNPVTTSPGEIPGVVMKRFRRRRSRLLLAPVRVLVGALALASCYSGNSAGPKVAVNGDSITNVSVWPINDALQPDYYVNVQGQDGATIGESLRSYRLSSRTPRALHRT